MNTTAYRGLIVVVLITCTMLVLWWVVPKPEDRGGYLVTAVPSGSAVTVSRDGETHTVYLAGVNAPGEGQCGFKQAQQNLAGPLQGASVVVIRDSRSRTSEGDWSGYVELNAVDVGLAQIKEGFAEVADGGFDRRAEYDEAAKDVEPAFSC